VIQVVEHLPNMCKALSSNPSTTHTHTHTHTNTHSQINYPKHTKFSSDFINILPQKVLNFLLPLPLYGQTSSEYCLISLFHFLILTLPPLKHLLGSSVAFLLPNLKVTSLNCSYSNSPPYYIFLSSNAFQDTILFLFFILCILIHWLPLVFFC
jgi:hypothetical protein